jgi:hypothetical protein
MKPYVGIADFSNRQQAQEAFDFFNKNKPEGLDLLFHVGVMMSYKTFYGIPTEWEAIFPKKEEIAKIFFQKKPIIAFIMSIIVVGQILQTVLIESFLLVAKISKLFSLI